MRFHYPTPVPAHYVVRRTDGVPDRSLYGERALIQHLDAIVPSNGYPFYRKGARLKYAIYTLLESGLLAVYDVATECDLAPNQIAAALALYFPPKSRQPQRTRRRGSGWRYPHTLAALRDQDSHARDDEPYARPRYLPTVRDDIPRSDHSPSWKRHRRHQWKATA